VGGELKGKKNLLFPDCRDLKMRGGEWRMLIDDTIRKGGGRERGRRVGNRGEESTALPKRRNRVRRELHAPERKG